MNVPALLCIASVVLGGPGCVAPASQAGAQQPPELSAEETVNAFLDAVKELDLQKAQGFVLQDEKWRITDEDQRRFRSELPFGGSLKFEVYSKQERENEISFDVLVRFADADILDSEKAGKLVARRVPEGWRVTLTSSDRKKLQDPEQLREVGMLPALVYFLSEESVYEESRMKAQATHALSNGRMLGTAVHLWLADYDDRFPTGDWVTTLAPYVSGKDSVWAAPPDKAGTRSFSPNTRPSGRRVGDLRDPSRTILLYLGKNETLEARYNSKGVVVLADSSAKLVTSEEFSQLRWTP